MKLTSRLNDGEVSSCLPGSMKLRLLGICRRHESTLGEFGIEHIESIAVFIDPFQLIDNAVKHGFFFDLLIDEPFEELHQLHAHGRLVQGRTGHRCGELPLAHANKHARQASRIEVYSLFGVSMPASVARLPRSLRNLYIFIA